MNSHRPARIAWLVAVLCAVALVAGAQEYKFKDITLENGLRIVTLEDFSTPIVAVQVWYHVGSKNEDPNRQGFAHMFEHMMFRGTDRLGPEDHFEYIRRTGGNANAFTSFDYTAYVNEIPANQLEMVLWLEAERMMYLKVDQEGFVTERQVVSEERRQDLNEPYGTVAEKLLPVIFHQLPYKWTPIGRIAHLEAADVSELRDFWEAFYVPDNAVLVVAGAVKHGEAQELAKKYFGWMPKCPQPPRTISDEPPQTEPREATLDEPQGPIPLAGYAFRGVPEDHPDYVPLDLLTGILGYGDSSRLYLDLVKDQKIASQVLASAYGFEKAGIFGAGASVLPGASTDQVLAALDKHLQRVIDEPVTERELTKIRNQYRRMLVTEQMTVARKAQLLGEAATTHGDPDWLNQRLEKLDAATVEDLQRVAKQYIVPTNRSTIRVVPKPVEGEGPSADGVAPEAAPTRYVSGAYCKEGVPRPEGFPEKPPVHSLLDEIPPGEMQEKTLDNGLRVVVVPNREVPFTSAKLGLKYGAWAEGSEQVGAASMALDMLTKGTHNYTADELAETVEFNALTLGGSADMDVAEVNATALAEKIDLALELMAEIVLRPTFPEPEFNLLKQQLESSLTIREKDPNYLADREMRRRIFGQHPYSRTVSGELADVEKLPLTAVKDWWKAYARPDAAVLYVSGDVKPRRVFEIADRCFGKWNAEGPAPEPKVAEIPASQPTHIYLVDNPGAVQSQIRAGQPSITRGHPLYHPSRVYSQIFGGSFGSRLNEVIRIQKGLTYGAGGGISPGRFSGTFYGHTFTKTPTTAETVKALLDVVSSMRSTPPTDDEVYTAKSYLVGSFPGQLETPQDRVEYQWIIDYNNLPKNYIEQAVQSYRNTTVDELKRVADEVVRPDELAIVVVADAKAVQADLEKVAPVTVVAQAPQAVPAAPPEAPELPGDGTAPAPQPQPTEPDPEPQPTAPAEPAPANP